MEFMKKALKTTWLLTLVGVAYLSAMLIILRPPNAKYLRWFFIAALIAGQGGLTLITMAFERANVWWRTLAMAGSMALALMGALMVRATLTGPHFEGFELILGVMLIAQGALTIPVFLKGHVVSA